MVHPRDNGYEQWAIPSNGLRELSYYHLDDTVWDQLDKVHVFVGTPDQKNAVYERKEIDTMPEEEAVCRFCFDVFREDHSVFKTVCRCKFTLIHDTCFNKWFDEKKSGDHKCKVCDQDIQYVPVSVFRASSSSIPSPTIRSSRTSPRVNSAPAGEEKLLSRSSSSRRSSGPQSYWSCCFC